MNEKAAVLQEVIGILKRLDPGCCPVTETVNILTELDFDSLKMLELVEALQAAFGINFLQDPYSMNDLRTPETIAAAVLASRVPDAR